MMMVDTAHGPRTLIDALIHCFAASLRTPEAVAPPVTLLWPDPDSQWLHVVARLRSSLACVYTMGSYNPATLSGPAIWLRCVVDRTLPDVSPPNETTPVLYLPGVSRQDLRAGADCASPLQPLIELQFRGRVWHHPNNREWTAEAFLTSTTGLDLDIARDGATREAMMRSLPLLADTDVTHLRGHRLSASDFDKLAVDDPIRDLLRWMNDPAGTIANLGGTRWQALRSMIRNQFDLDPEENQPTDAAAKLLQGGGQWDAAWQRFCENPRLYPGIPKLLRDPAVTGGELPLDMSRRPAENDEAEARLRRDLGATARLAHHDAATRVSALEQEHGERRNWVWAEIGDSLLAMALEPLARLAANAEQPLGGSTIEDMVERYTSKGWHCDAAAMAALAAPLRKADQAVVHAVVRTIYLPWLEDAARNFQALAGTSSDQLREMMSSPTPKRDVCILFVDGLRFDVGGELHAELQRRGLSSGLHHRIAPMPTVTPTAKPAATPIADKITGPQTTDAFYPIITESQQTVNAQRLRAAMDSSGIEVLDADEVRLPTGDRGGWTEGGQLDELGHKLGIRLAEELPKEVDRLADRIATLLEGGWQRVRVVTDHGWLLMPGGLPKVDLPKFLTETRWARCAVVKGESATEMPVWSWYWNSAVRVATPPGVNCFIAGHEYMHGGISPQELITPELVVERGEPETRAAIVEVTWTRLRCRVQTSGAEGAKVDIRANWKDPNTSIVAALKEPAQDGQVALVVKDDEFEGAGAVVVLLDASGHVIDRKAITVGDA